MRVGHRLRVLLVALVTIGATVVTAPPASGITGGAVWATPGPHVMLLLSDGSSSLGGFCSGTVIAPTWVLTAAHCAEAAQLYESGGLSTRVVAGASRLDDAPDANIHPVDLGASVVHPFWDKAAMEHDLALLAVTPNEHGLPAPAPLPAGAISLGDELDLFGYGHDGSGSGDGVLRRAAATVDGLGTSTTFFSSGGVSGICTGDSGGAAMHDGTLVGVHSYTVIPGCPTQQAHSDVYAQLDWIRETAGLTAVDETAPAVIGPAVAPEVVTVGGAMTVSAVVDDGPDGSGVQSADYTLDGGATWTAMAAADGVFGDSAEDVTTTTAAPGTPDVLEVCVRAQDGAGHVADPSCAPVPVVDPDGGFVSGGGSFESPAGAVVDDPAAAGQATIGFVSGYRRGATQPQGSTRFVLRTAGLSLTADAFDWLVVRGDDTALLQGTGTLGDGRTVTFKLWAADHAPDTVRLRIWSEEQDVYDSGHVPLATGQVRVHA